MADSPISLSHAEIQALADRLAARATSKLFGDQPQTAGDMRQAAEVLRAITGPGLYVHQKLVDDE